MPQILVIDGDSGRGAACVAPLAAFGWGTAFVTDLPGARMRLDDGPTELILWSVADLQSVDRDFLHALHARPGTRLIALTSTLEPSFLTELLELGVTDYIARPFTPAQLVHRVRLVLDRPYPPGPVFTLLDGVWSLDTVRRELRKRGVVFTLTPNEMKVVECLAKARSGPVSTAALIRHLWGNDPAGTVMALSAYIRAIRKKMERNPAQPELLLSERGFAFRLVLDSPSPVRTPG